MAFPQRDPSLSKYIERVRRIPTLSREDEHDLAVLARGGDTAAAERLVEANLRYVVAVALQYRRYGVRLSDLVSEGSVGLMIAVRKFDPDRGTRFVTYAGYWIRAYVLDWVVRSTTMVGAGSGPLRSKLYFRLRRERAKVSTLYRDHEERIAAMAERFSVTPERMEEMLRRLDSRDVSLDQQVFDDGGPTLVDTLLDAADDQEVRLSRQQTQSLLEHRLGDAMSILDRRERYIVEHRMMGDDGMSLAAIGRELGVSRERARQLEARAKRKLRDRLGDLNTTQLQAA